jgi:hypothetical protein
MKKAIIIAFAIAATGLISSCSKDNSVKPASAQTQKSTVADKSDVGGGDFTGVTTHSDPDAAVGSGD